MSKLGKHYIGSDSIRVELLHDDVDEAVEAATKRLHKDCDLDHVNIVQVVAVVRRAEQPVVVEKLER